MAMIQRSTLGMNVKQHRGSMDLLLGSCSSVGGVGGGVYTITRALQLKRGGKC